MKEFVKIHLEVEVKRLVVDIGSRDFNGNYRELFDKNLWDYVGVDITTGKNVDVILSDPYDWSKEFDNEVADVVISGQAFEHIEYFWKTMYEIDRILKPRGLICIITPFSGKKHLDDYYRFTERGLEALARMVDFEIVSSDCNEESPWKDSILVAKKPIRGINERRKTYQKSQKNCGSTDWL